MEKVSAKHSCPGIVVSALRGGSGKTIFSIGIIAALRNRGVRVAPYKKGPDYIDAGWLSLAAGRPCYNLDTFLIEPAVIDRTYQVHSQGTHAAVVEGNRGLYDCIDTDGMTSTAELAKQLNLPVLLCLDVTKTTRTTAAVVGGCMQFDPKVLIGGVVLNRVAGARHEKIVRDSIEQYCGIPVLGAVPKLRKQNFPERHMGLVPTYEHQWAHDAVEVIADLAEQYLDIPAIAKVAGATFTGAECTPHQAIASINAEISAQHRPRISGRDSGRPVVGVIKDSAFQFYYPENLEALVQAGAEIVITSPLFEDAPPQVDALYIGGGFPETHAARLAKNVTYRNRIKALAEKGLPIYAECGGLMYLGTELILEDGQFPMAGVLPVRFGFSRRPQGHGYTVIKVADSNPFFDVGQTLKGHEFHYSTVQIQDGVQGRMVFEMLRGTGIHGNCDGFTYKNVLATYTHIHALGTPQWAPALVSRAREFRHR